ncbi:MAG: TetR family transcriptional regulator C-terminal domain-containing protein [Pseudonocardiales bacterium]|nr:TetR family transcriptional regulator C-terminal domain-containing protein [Pseudonocardiales bacterium]
MPKVVDRDERKRTIAEALLRLVARQGIEKVSVRTVAAEAGISAGAVQKYFATKEDMLAVAFELTGEFLVRRWADIDAEGPFIEVLREHIVAALPLDEQRRAELVIVFAFTARAAAQPDWARRLQRDYGDAHDLTTRFLRFGQSTGEVRDDLDVERLADLVLALTDGLSARLLHTPLLRSPQHDELLASLDLALHELLAPR